MIFSLKVYNFRIMGERLGKAVEAVRTAPYGFSSMSANVLAAAGAVVAANMNMGLPDTALEAAVYGNIGLGATVGAAWSGRQVVRQFRTRQRVEDVLDGQGFDEVALSNTTDEWCTRQAARVACENAGELHQYEDLCEQRRDSARFRWLPHF